MMAGLLVLVLLLPAAAPGANEAYRAGQAAFRAGDTKAAEDWYRKAVELDPTNVEALLQLAKLVSWRNALDESIGIYRRALSVDPGNLRGRLGLARVESWAGDYGKATETYEGILAEHPGHREATLGLARTRAWAGDTSRARAIYARLLEADPHDVEARNGLAQVLSWEGRLDEALSLYEQTLAEEPGNADALAGRARVLMWQGRAPQAWQAVNEAAKLHPGERNLVGLRKDLEDAFASNLDVSTRLLHDSDRNAINTQRAVFTFFPALPLSLALTYTRVEATQPCKRIASTTCDPTDPGIPGDGLATRLETLGGRASYRLRPDVVLSGSAGLDRIVRRRDDTSLHGAASAGVDWRLNDRWTLSGSLSRETFVATAQTLDRGVGLAAATATAGWTPFSNLGTRLSVQRMETSDDNGRDLLSGYARWTLPVRRPRLALSWNSRYLSYDDPLVGRENGYFAPDYFVANVAGFEISDTLRGRLGLSAEGTLGRQEVRVLPGSERSNDTVRGWYLRASWAIGSRVSLEAWLGRTNLALQGPTGFGTVESGLRLRWKTGWPSHGGVSR